MARTKKAPKAAPPPQVEGEERFTVVNLKGSTDYVAWFDGINKKTLIPKTSIIRQAVKEWAKAHGHEPPPEI